MYKVRTVNIYKCEMCKGGMTSEEYFFCDICPDCLDDTEHEETNESVYSNGGQ
tara:strand:- start:7469 stop:7627 length:159 start_codon:yes stop_codon:yes gene_type:complete